MTGPAFATCTTWIRNGDRPWAIGRIPDHNWNAIDQNLYRIVEIYDNAK